MNIRRRSQEYECREGISLIEYLCITFLWENTVIIPTFLISNVSEPRYISLYDNIHVNVYLICTLYHKIGNKTSLFYSLSLIQEGRKTDTVKVYREQTNRLR